MCFQTILLWEILEAIFIVSDRLRKRRVRGRVCITIINLAIILTIFLALFDYISQIEKPVHEFTGSAEDIAWRIDIIFRDFHPSQNRRYQEQKQNSENHTDNHESDAIPSFFLVFFLGMREDEHDDGANERIYAS